MDYYKFWFRMISGASFVVACGLSIIAREHAFAAFMMTQAIYLRILANE